MTATVGILGGGQLGCMLARSVVALGALPVLFDPQEDAPAHREFETVRARFDDVDALTAFFTRCDVVTYEREHLDVSALRRVPAAASKVVPSLEILEIAQDRVREKTLFLEAGAPPVPHYVASGKAELLALSSRLGSAPLIAKLTRGGYDGKGQWAIRSESDLQEVARLAKEDDAWVIEERVELIREASVIVGRSKSGVTHWFPVFENEHRDHVLDRTFCPAAFEGAERLPALAVELAERLDLVGLLTVEFFIAEGDTGIQIFANEIAPRPHNSGHVSRTATKVSQFDLLASILVADAGDAGKALDPGPPGEIAMASRGVYCMANLLGDLWFEKTTSSGAPGGEAPLELVLYGKRPVRGRKLGHLTVVAETREEAGEKALRARRSFQDELHSP